MEVKVAPWGQYVDASGASLRRIRKPNFSDDEILTIIEEVGKEREIILAKLAIGIPRIVAKKNQAWGRVTFKINAMFGTNRSRGDIKKKWKDLKGYAKRMTPENRHTVSERRAGFADQILQIVKSHQSDMESDDESTNEITKAGNYSPPCLMMGFEAEDGDEKDKEPTTNRISVSADLNQSNSSCVELLSNDNITPVSTNHTNSHSNQSDFKTFVSDDENESTSNSQPHSSLINHTITVPTIQPNHPPRSIQSRFSSINSRNLSPQQVPRPSGSNCMESLRAKKLRLKIKWLESEIQKNDSIVELNRTKADYVRAKQAKLEM